MPEVFIPLEEVAVLEGIGYFTLHKRTIRNPADFKIKTQPREGGGKDQVMVALSSLSAKARKAYKATQKVDGRDVIIEKRADATPWFVEVDLNHYIESNKKAFYEAVDLAARVQDFIEYGGDDRTEFAERFALGIGVSPQTLYRYAQGILEANAWAIKFEREDGMNRDYFRALSLCRKPRDKGTFPSLTDEQRAVIENIWFDKTFASNFGTIEMLFEKFEELAQKRGWEKYPSIKTVARYINHIMDTPGAESARYLAANGLREWKNKKQVKCKRDATTLDVMEYVVADAHTFDVWVQHTAPNGKVKAIRPMLVAWLDMKSRRFLGSILCEHSNTQIVKQSFVKMVYEAGCVPVHVHIDNGKDFASNETLGQNRKQRSMDDALMDAEFKGFYLAMGARDWSRSLPFQPWDKPIERAFNTFCLRYSRKFKSYTGTLTASKTEAKRHKDINKMLERGELLTMEEFMDVFNQFLAEWYDVREHRGLKDSGEQWTKPGEVWEHAARCGKAAPPREYAAMLLMKPDKARVTTQGITKFKTLYTAPELAHYEGRWVGLRWDVDDVTKLYVYDQKTGHKICEAYSAELLQFGSRVSQVALEELHSRKNRQLKEVRDYLNERITPYEQRLEPSAPAAVGKIDLTIGHAPQQKVVALPQDKEYRAELAASGKRRKSGDEFLGKKANDALSRLRAINE